MLSRTVALPETQTMSTAAIASELRDALGERASADGGLRTVIGRIERLTPGEHMELVTSQSWGDLILARLPNEDAFKLLRVLSDARPPPALRNGFFASFDCQGLCEACAEQLRAPSSNQDAVDIRLCIRNLARNPAFRLRLSSAVSIIASSLNDDGMQLDIAAAGAAALCNICCDNTLKMEAVRLGTVRAALHHLKRSPTYTAAEDLLACVGVLTAGYPPGMEALFNSGDAPVILACLCSSDSASLQVLALELLSDLCSCSKSFTAWLVDDADLLPQHLGRCLSLDGNQQMLSAALQLCNRLSEHDTFAAKVQRGSTMQALCRIAELPPETEAGNGDPLGGRRPPTNQEQAKALLGRILHF